MSQKSINQKVEKWLTDVDRLRLRFPIAEIADKTGFDKGNISAYLKRKKLPSDNFLTTFYEKFSDFLNGANGITIFDDQLKEAAPDPYSIIASLAQANKDYAEGFKALANVVDRMEKNMARADALADVASNLKIVLNNQDGGLGIVIETLLRDVKREAAGSKDKERKILADIGRRIGPDLYSHFQNDKRPSGGI